MIVCCETINPHESPNNTVCASYHKPYTEFLRPYQNNATAHISCLPAAGGGEYVKKQQKSHARSAVRQFQGLECFTGSSVLFAASNTRMVVAVCSTTLAKRPLPCGRLIEPSAPWVWGGGGGGLEAFRTTFWMSSTDSLSQLEALGLAFGSFGLGVVINSCTAFHLPP